MPPAATSSRSAPARSTVVAAIPARYGSTRLPGKPLLPLAGRPMVQHVWERASRAPGIGRVVVLTDDERVARAVEGFGGEVEMTPAECHSGTDRIAYAARHWEAEAVINVQGDEPLIDPESVGRIARHLVEHPEHPMVTLATPAEPDERDDPHAVKVVTDLEGCALYFSRARIPFPRHPESETGRTPLKHVGVYGYRRETLLELAALPPTPHEQTEGLEQLRALENGIRIRVLMSERPSPGVDTRIDLDRVEQMIRQREERAGREDRAPTSRHSNTGGS